MNSEDWNKFCQVFNLNVNVSVPKQVTREDIILTLLNEGEIAFKGKRSNFILKVKYQEDKNIINKLVTKEINEYVEEQTILKDQTQGVKDE